MVDVQLVMEKTIEHLKGPPGKMVVGEGVMKFPGGNYPFITARYVISNQPDLLEGVQVDFISPTDDGATGLAGAGRQYRVVQNGDNVPNTVSYFPSLRRGRIVAYVPLQGVLGSDQKFYFLPLVSVLKSFSYHFVSEKDRIITLEGTLISGTAAFQKCFVELEHKESTFKNVFVPRALHCSCQEGTCVGTISQELSQYMPIEGAPGYWAASIIRSGSTVITFTRWWVQDPVEWILSPSHALLGGRYTLTQAPGLN